jgi:hypothetical protein
LGYHRCMSQAEDAADWFRLAPTEREVALRADLQKQARHLRSLLSASGVAQEEIMEFRERYDRLPSTTPLPPVSLRRLHEGRALYLRLQEQLVDLARRYKQLLGLDEEALEELQIERVLQARGVLTSFVAALALHDNYLSMRTILEDSRLRRLMTDPLRGYGLAEEDVLDVVESLNDPSAQRRLRALLHGYDEVSDELVEMQDPEVDFLQLAVEASATYHYAKQHALTKHLPTGARLARERILDVIDQLGRSALGTLSEVFGNGIGLIETRKGKLWGRVDLEAHLAQTLQPLDMLLEKTPFRLTDKFIPGHFGHVAIWIGSTAQLEPFHLWDDKVFQRTRCEGCRSAVEEGRSVLEALRTGVQLSSLAEFLNVDDLAVLRPRGLTEEERRASLLRGFQQVGKQYDFNFEVETVDKITCSELPYHVYPGVHWKTDEQLGQFTISPDQVASTLFDPEAPFQLLELYHDGKEVTAEEALPLVRRLLDA